MITPKAASDASVEWKKTRNKAFVGRNEGKGDKTLRHDRDSETEKDFA